jgi:hypothetical protein
MKIIKNKEQVVYQKMTTEHEFELNGKKVRVYVSKDDDALAGYELDYHINESDMAKLTEEELELFEESIDDLIELDEKETRELI